MFNVQEHNEYVKGLESYFDASKKHINRIDFVLWRNDNLTINEFRKYYNDSYKRFIDELNDDYKLYF